MSGTRIDDWLVLHMGPARAFAWLTTPHSHLMDTPINQCRTKDGRARVAHLIDSMAEMFAEGGDCA